MKNQLATFRVEVTPRVGDPLCAGWMPPAREIVDPLWAGGIVLVAEHALPIVLCAIDWCEISNRTHRAWRQALADAVGTTPERVTVHCMHAHCSPWPDEVAQRLMDEATGTEPIMAVEWCHAAMERVAQSAREAMATLQLVTHLATGKAKVEQVASNRRIMGDDGYVKAVRWTRTLDPSVRAEPEGVIDPWLKTLSFWNEERKLASLHYYAVHPSSYEDSLVTPDFCGLARQQRIREDNGTPHFYFTECAGDITAGKYNDGAHENRALFTARIHRAMIESEQNAARVPLRTLAWKTAPIHLPPRDDEPPQQQRALLDDATKLSKFRSRAALSLAYQERAALPIEIAALHLNEDVCLLHLPSEAFIEYQLFAQRQRPDAFVVAPAYGDCGPGYICLEHSFDEGGYEPRDAFVSPRSEPILKDAIRRVLLAGATGASG